MRVVSYNVHACIGRDRRFRPDRIAAVLKSLEADVIGLQEVEERIIDGIPVSDYLAARLGMHAYRGPTLRRRDAHYGNLLLSSRPAHAQVAHDLSVGQFEPRGAIEAHFDVAGRQVAAFVTHFGLFARERRRQAAMLLRVMQAARAEFRVLLGDLNEWRPGRRWQRQLAALCGASPAPRTFPARLPALALDRVCAAPPGTLGAVQAVRDHRSVVASDHLPLVAEVRLTGGAETHEPE